jgi:hypothetical protein
MATRRIRKIGRKTRGRKYAKRGGNLSELKKKNSNWNTLG